MNDKLLGETKRPGKKQTAVGGVTITVDRVVTDAIKELLQLMGVNLLTWAVEIGKDIEVVSIIVAVYHGILSHNMWQAVISC